MSEKILLEQIKISLRPLKDLLESKDITDIVVFRHDKVAAKKMGEKFRLEENVRWERPVDLRMAVNQIARQMKKKLDRENPIIDARLVEDNSRVNIMIEPVYDRETFIAIRRFLRHVEDFGDLFGLGTLDEIGLRLISSFIKLRKNIIISGGTGSGKTSLLNAICKLIPENEVVVTVEDVKEIKLKNPFWASLEAKMGLGEGEQEITMADLVKTTLRVPVSWIIVGEVRGKEIMDLLRAFNTGHAGLGTIHANNAELALHAMQRLLMNSSSISMSAAKEEISSAIDILIQLKRYPDEIIRIEEILEIKEVDHKNGMAHYTTNSLYKFNIKEVNPEEIKGDFKIGNKPTFYEEIKMFDPEITKIWGQG